MYLVIDGLGECTTGRDELLDFVAELATDNVRALVFSRNYNETV